MASIKRLEVSRVRNLTQLCICPGPRINVIHGDNGSGKTSLLESIHMLGIGRSFRSTRLEPVIQSQAEDCTLFAELSDGAGIGLSKSRRDRHVLKLLGERQKSWAEVARRLPVQVLNSDTFALLEGSPKVRRRFLDWGVFHVEHEFVEDWRAASRCLSNRNSLLKQHSLDTRQLEAWDAEYARLAHRIDEWRGRYFASFLPQFHATLEQLIDLPDLRLSYNRGWDAGKSFSETLERNRDRDRRYGATQQGPHRADLQVRVGTLNAVDILSRGQQKMLVSALKIAQGHLLSEATRLSSIYLVDDLPSELDQGNKEAVCDLLGSLDTQIFMSCVGPDELEGCWPDSLITGKFHVEHGKIGHTDP